MSAAQTSVSASLPLGPCLLLHYLKHSLVFICRAGDVASSSTFPSRAVYIREPIWRYKTRQRKGGGPEPRESGAVEAILRSGELRARRPTVSFVKQHMKDIFRCNIVKNQLLVFFLSFIDRERDKFDMIWVKRGGLGRLACLLVVEWWTMIRQLAER